MTANLVLTVEGVEILLWLVPPVVVTVLAMVWVGWVGRERRELDRDEAVRRLGKVLDKEPRPLPRRTPVPRERSTGVAVRKPPVVEEVAQQPSRDLAS
jgi:hypothetical protein